MLSGFNIYLILCQITKKVPIKQFDFDNYTIPADAVIKIPL